MSKQFHLAKDEGLIELIYDGGITPEDFIEYRDYGEQVCSENGINKILVDCSKALSLPATIDIFDHGACLATSTVLGRLKHAIVVNEAIIDDIYFMETVSKNRGVNLQFFKTRAEALAWLNESPIKTSGDDKKISSGKAITDRPAPANPQPMVIKRP